MDRFFRVTGLSSAQPSHRGPRIEDRGSRIEDLVLRFLIGQRYAHRSRENTWRQRGFVDHCQKEGISVGSLANLGVKTQVAVLLFVLGVHRWRSLPCLGESRSQNLARTKGEPPGCGTGVFGEFDDSGTGSLSERNASGACDGMIYLSRGICLRQDTRRAVRNLR